MSIAEGRPSLRASRARGLGQGPARARRAAATASAIARVLASRLGLRRCPPLHRDGEFLLALLAGVPVWLGLWLLAPAEPAAPGGGRSWRLVLLVLWQPCLEELVFRGFLQGALRRVRCGRAAWRRLTLANAAASLVFALAHAWQHPPAWAAAVVVPSLVFGYFRDRYGSVYPPALLHAWYNAGYFLLNGVP